MKTVLDVQAEIQRALECLPNFENQLPAALRPLLGLAPPKGTRAQVSLRHGDFTKSRQIKSNAPADSWSPDSDIVAISFEEAPLAIPEAVAATVIAQAPVTEPTKEPEIPAATYSDDPLRDLILTLAKAERDPQMSFVALKWFRDVHLSQKGMAWAATSQNRQRVLVDAIERSWILTNKVANPKNPQFPVTAIKVNRTLPEVRRILDQETGVGSRFAPVPLPGERLSDTVLNARR